MIMQLASLIHQYLVAFKAKYAAQLLPGHLRAIGAILRCRTTGSGELLLACTDCDAQLHQPRSCGHRSCAQCQNHETSRQWKKTRGKFLFKYTALARVFRARLLAALKATGSDTTHSESDYHRRARSAQTGVHLRQVPITDADSGLYPACLGIRVDAPKLQTHHSPHTGNQRHFMTKTSVFC
jgi:hypothetical protein